MKAIFDDVTEDETGALDSEDFEIVVDMENDDTVEENGVRPEEAAEIEIDIKDSENRDAGGIISIEEKGDAGGIINTEEKGESGEPAEVREDREAQSPQENQNAENPGEAQSPQENQNLEDPGESQMFQENQDAWDPAETEEPKAKGKKKALIISMVIILALVLAGAGGWYYIDSRAYKLCRVEAGVEVTPSDFLKTADEDACFAEGSQPFDITEPGEYHVKVKSGLFTHNCTLIIEDTIAPWGEGRKVQMEMGDSCEAEEFLSNVSDATAVTVSFAAEPDFTKAGEQPVRLLLEDKGGNQTTVEAVLFITQVQENVTVEVGGEAPGVESFVIAGQDAAFVTDIEEIDFTKVGEHEITVIVDGMEYASVLHVVDTTPPQAEVRDVEGYVSASINVEEFIVSVEDATEVTPSFKEEPDMTLVGVREVEIIFTDEGGNETVKQAKLTLMKDTEPPVIAGAKDLTVYMGDGVSYRKNVSVQDNCPEGVELTVDTSAVNLDAEGVYPVTYTATDLAGNQTSVTVNLTVKSREFNPDKAYAMADEVLSKIITDGMSEMDKVTAIYDYVKGHIGYVSHSEKGDWLKAAYEGLSTGQGDCYTYAHTSRLLLDRAGIKNMIIEKIPAKTNHVWNLVDIGDGWYHFDACPRRGLTEKVLMWTDERLMEYSDSHNKSHNYDRNVYTGIN